MTHGELYEAIAVFKRVLAEDRERTVVSSSQLELFVFAPPPPRPEFTLKVERPTIELFLDYLQSMDPDMPPRPLCKALGPLVGDMMMNAKLNRLDDLANALGPMTLRLGMIVEQLERRRVR